jgi:hypothetical protein
MSGKGITPRSSGAPTAGRQARAWRPAVVARLARTLGVINAALNALPPSRPMQPYRLRTRIRGNLPWWLINLGVAPKGPNCEEAGGQHEWYNRDNASSGCYHCEVVRPGKLWSSHTDQLAGADEQHK